MIANVTALVSTKWYFGMSFNHFRSRVFDWHALTGIPFNDTQNFRFAIAEVAESVLGDNLLGLQAANEPDLYAAYVFPSSIVMTRESNSPLHSVMAIGTRRTRRPTSSMNSVLSSKPSGMTLRFP